MGLIDKLSPIFSKNKNTENYYLMSSVDDSLEKVIQTMDDMDIQTIITTSTGEWADKWGYRFKVQRKEGESDAQYTQRIIDYVKIQHGTIPALIDAVKRALGDDTQVTPSETYNDLRIFNISTFSGTGKYQDSGTVRLGVVKLTINKEPNAKLAEEIFKSKASGTRVIIESTVSGTSENL